MKKKSLIEIAALFLTITMIICLCPSQKIKAYGEDGTKEVDGYVFTYDPELGFYVTGIDKGWGAVTYFLIDQGLINKLGGTLPYYVREDMSVTTHFYLGENITVTKGLVVPYHSSIAIDMQGRQITYTPDDISEVMWDGITNAPVSISLYNSYNFNYIPSQNGKVYSPYGATLFSAGSESYSTGSISITDVDLLGGYDSNYTDVRNSAVKVVGNGAFSAYYDRNGCVIKDFSAEYGGAIYTEGARYEVPGGGYTYGPHISLERSSIRHCYAEVGGGIYLQGQLQLYGDYNYSEQTSEFNYGIMGCVAAERGGGVCAEGPYAMIEANNGSCITENLVVSDKGGGIYIESDPDQISYKLTVSGAAKIAGNVSLEEDGDANDLYLNYKGRAYDCIYVDMSRVKGSSIGITGAGFTSGSSVVQGYSYHESYMSDLENAFFFENSKFTLLSPKKNGDGTRAYMTLVKGDGSQAAALSGYSILTGGYGVGIKFHVYIPEDDEIGEPGDDIWTAKISAASDQELFTLGKNEKTIPVDNYYREDDGCVTFTYYVDSTDMTVPLQFDLYKNGELVDSMTGFTVRDYIDAVCKDYKKYGLYSYQGAVSLAMYGAAAQEYFGFRTDDLADKNITDVMKENTEFKDYETTNLVYDYEPSYGNMPYYVPAGDHVSFYGWTMIFTGAPSVKYYFYVPDKADVDKIEISFTHNFNRGTVETYKTSGSYYCVKLSNLSMADLYGTINIKIKYNDTGEDEIDLSCKPISYLHWLSNDIGSTYSSKAHKLADTFILYSKKYYY